MKKINPRPQPETKPCEYCTDEYEKRKLLPRTRYGNFFESYCNAYIEDTGAIEFEFCSEDADIEIEWDIHFCPMCGKSLKEVKQDG